MCSCPMNVPNLHPRKFVCYLSENKSNLKNIMITLKKTNCYLRCKVDESFSVNFLDGIL